MLGHIPGSLLIVVCAAPLIRAQTVAPPFDTKYTIHDLGSVPGVPTNYGGLTFQAKDPNFLLIGGSAGNGSGAIYQIRVQRDAQNRVTGFLGTASRFMDAANIDGGLAYGPYDVLFHTRYSANQIGQTKPGNVATDKVVDLSPLGVASSVGSLTFVPTGFPAAGQLKIVSYNANTFYSATVRPDANGTFDILNVTLRSNVGGGPEGITYVPPGSPLFQDYSFLLVGEYRNGKIAVWRIDQNGDPVPNTRQDFVNGLIGVEGATIDPATGDFFFSTYGGSNRVVKVTGFGQPCASFASYGNGLAGSGGRIPLLGGSGCAARNLITNFHVTNGLGGAGGLMILGIQKASIPVFGGVILADPLITITHALDGGVGVPGAGTYTFSTRVPDDGNLVGKDFFVQSVYLDPGAVQFLSMTAGLASAIR